MSSTLLPKLLGIRGAKPNNIHGLQSPFAQLSSERPVCWLKKYAGSQFCAAIDNGFRNLPIPLLLLPYWIISIAGRILGIKTFLQIGEITAAFIPATIIWAMA